MLALFLFAAATFATPVDTPTVYSGRAGQVAVRPPRLADGATIDGVLDEPQWRAAALLVGFSQFTPVDGVAADDSTEVRVWYSATALYIGIHAIDRTGTVRATLATRDQIFSDDNVQIFLSTFNDGRQATVFAVNPFGVQADGAVNESGATTCNLGACAIVTRQQPDLSQDFVWDSKGRLTADGYDVEIRIPFKSIRFQSGKTQTWGINFLRVVQRSGQEQTWTQVRRASSSFLGQAGRLEELTGLEAGHVLDIVPTATSRVTGAPPSAGAPFDYTWGRPQFGADLRYGITPNLTLHATAHPDFSQVESDVTEFSFDPRQAVFYPEKRPFFLDGVEQFDAPNNLIYTRRIVQPVFAGKMTGKVGDDQVGVLAAVDDRSASLHGDNPIFGIVRASHDLGPGARVALAWTEQHDGPETNRVIDADSRIVIDTINAITLNGALAHDDDGAVNNAAMWGVGYRRDGRNFRTNYSFSGVGTNFVTRSGFITQPGIVDLSFSNSYTWLTERRTLESITGEVIVAGHWRYDDFVHGDGIQNRQLHFNLNARFKGGWNAGLGYYRESYGYDPSIYVDYALLHPDGSITPFTGGGMRLPNTDYIVTGNTPTWKQFDLNVFFLTGLNDENYSEWASGRTLISYLGANYRPTDHLRFSGSYSDNRVYRPLDGSRVLVQAVASGTVEYQISRAFQLRVIGLYSINARDSLRDESRTSLPIVIRNAAGVFVSAAAYDDRALQLNFLFTYLPNPGTVIYLGYGNLNQRPDLAGLTRFGAVENDWFVKLSYLWRKKS